MTRGDKGDPAATLLRLSGDFSGTNASVATSLDGVQFGPYPDGGQWGGSVRYSGLNGQPLSSISQLSYRVMYSSSNGAPAPIASPYLRVFLDGDTHDVVFDPSECATATPQEDAFVTFDVTGADTLRYDDDACGAAYDPQTWAEIQAAHGSKIISGILVTQGFSGGATISALLRSISVNGTEYVFGAA